MHKPAETPAILTSLPPAKRYRLIGEIIALMTQSKVHQVYRVEDLPLTILIPVQLNQFRIYRDSRDEPVALVTWGMFSAEVEKTFLKQSALLTAEDWHSGDIVYFTDFIAPHGHAKQVIKDLRKRFHGRKVYSVHYDGPNQRRARVRKFRGYGEEI